jgi:hypothetical protein
LSQLAASQAVEDELAALKANLAGNQKDQEPTSTPKDL